jgi:para-nitrobenzyl esterase
MAKHGLTRRDVSIGALACGLVCTAPIEAWAQTPEQTSPIETRTGRVRGLRSRGVSKFLGIPYGADTAARRFQPALPAVTWTGVRDCFAYGNSAFQGGGSFFGPRPGVDAEKMRLFMTLFMSGTDERLPTESENCLVLNVWTPDASHTRKRPVMLYLHGGGFAQGSGSTSAYDGSALCRRGDVVVVTINHRLNALGYLYLGGINEDFADSGNVGQLDQILALQWVRDNIAAFGGDPGNVTVFGQSGGGAKVSTLLAMPGAHGLFHKAIIQSGPGLKMAERADANALAERMLTALGIAKADVHRLQTLDPKAVIDAATAAQAGGGGRSLSPTVDGRSLPRHPFDPDAPVTARNIPLMIGTCKDEQTLFSFLDPDFGHMSADQVRQRFATTLHDRADATLHFFRNRRPNDPPTYWYTSMLTDSSTWINSIRLAERKVAQQAGPVYMYRLDWETPVLNGSLRTPHGLDTGLVFDNAPLARGLVGPAPAPDHIGAEMSQAFANFAHTGNPAQRGLAWPRYDVTARQTMIFNVPSHVVGDPDRDVRAFFVA